MRQAHAPVREYGFSLLEVMIALIIICVGLLGIAKLEALMLSSTGTSRLRALVALQAASLADAMHADRDYWDGSSTYWNAQSGNLSLTGTETSGNTLWGGTNAPAAGVTINCDDVICNSELLAAFDLQNWAANMKAVLQNSTTAIACAYSTVNAVVSCTITIQWSENTVAANSQEAAVGAPTAFQQQTYTLVVQP